MLKDSLRAQGLPRRFPCDLFIWRPHISSTYAKFVDLIHPLPDSCCCFFLCPHNVDCTDKSVSMMNSTFWLRAACDWKSPQRKTATNVFCPYDMWSSYFQEATILAWRAGGHVVRMSGSYNMWVAINPRNGRDFYLSGGEIKNSCLYTSWRMLMAKWP